MNSYTDEESALTIDDPRVDLGNGLNPGSGALCGHPVEPGVLWRDVQGDGCVLA